MINQQCKPIASQLRQCFGVHIIAAIFTIALIISALADEYEEPQPAEPANILGRKAFGTNYQLQNPVYGDGFLRFYQLSTFYGSIKVIGDELLHVRINELNALQILEELKLDPQFNRDFDKAIESSLSFSNKSTQQRRSQSRSINSGIDMMFQHVGKSTPAAKQEEDSKDGSSSTINLAKRHIAYRLGVDPYTDYKPLADQLNLLSRAGKKGADLILSTLKSTQEPAKSSSVSLASLSTLQLFIRNHTPSELKTYNRKLLIDMDIDEGTVDDFLANVHFTISDQTTLCAALDRLKNATDRHIFLSQAANSRHREVAFFHKRRAELLAEYHEHRSPIKKFISVAEFPFVQLENGNLLGLLVVDELAWTEVAAQAMQSIKRSLDAQKLSAPVEIHITGAATKLAKSNLEQLQWSVFTKTKFQ